MVSESIKNKILFNYGNIYINYAVTALIANNCAYFSGVYDELDNIDHVSTVAFGYFHRNISTELVEIEDGWYRYLGVLFDSNGRVYGNHHISYEYNNDTDLLKGTSDVVDTELIYGKYGELISASFNKFIYKFINGKLRITHHIMEYSNETDVDIYIYDKCGKLIHIHTLYNLTGKSGDGLRFDVGVLRYK